MIYLAKGLGLLKDLPVFPNFDTNGRFSSLTTALNKHGISALCSQAIFDRIIA
jgi:hypothetical protein